MSENIYTALQSFPVSAVSPTTNLEKLVVTEWDRIRQNKAIPEGYENSPNGMAVAAHIIAACAMSSANLRSRILTLASDRVELLRLVNLMTTTATSMTIAPPPQPGYKLYSALCNHEVAF